MILATRSFRSLGMAMLLSVVCAGCAAVEMSSTKVELNQENKITVDEARVIVQAIFKSDELQHEITLEEYQNEHSPEFYGFEALRSNPGGSANVGFYLVNPWTGDIWDIWSCKLVENPIIKKIQNKIRQHLKLSGTAYNKAHTLKPFCYEDVPSH